MNGSSIEHYLEIGLHRAVMGCLSDGDILIYYITRVGYFVGNVVLRSKKL